MQRPRFFGLVAAGMAASALLVGCGGDAGSSAPLTLEERLLPVADAPGFELSKDFSWSTAEGAVSEGVGPAFNEANPEQGIEAFEAAGFVAGVAEVLSKGDAAGEDNLIVLALQFGSEEGAKNVHEFLHADNLLAVPGSCSTNIAEFDVEDIPDATGVARTLSGGAGERCPDRYLVDFTDGSFLYLMERVVPSGSGSSEGQAAAISFATTLYERVKGAPLPSS